jgi:hypothetical protein
MKPPGPRNLAASVAARLRDMSRRTGDDYQILLGAWEDPAREVQIRAFGRRSGIPVSPSMAKDMLPVLRAFLLPTLDEVRRGTNTLGEWPPGGPWRSRG